MSFEDLPTKIQQGKDRKIDILEHRAERDHRRSAIECTIGLEAAFYLHAATKSEPLKCQNTDKPLTRMKIVDLPTMLLSIHKVERRIHTKRPHTSQHRAGILNGSHRPHYVAQYPELSTHSLGKMSLTHLQARVIRDTPTESKICNADHQPAKQTTSIRARKRDKPMLLLEKATGSASRRFLVHRVNSSWETDVLRLTNQLQGVSPCFYSL